MNFVLFSFLYNKDKENYIHLFGVLFITLDAVDVVCDVWM